MSRPLALLRPEPGWSATAAAARAAGLEVIGHPLFEVEAIAWEPSSGRFDALLIGSAAVFRHGGSNLRALRELPVHAVGETTAQAARAAGFRVERTGAGSLQSLLNGDADNPLSYLRLSGEERVELTPHPGQRVVERTVYRMNPVALSPAFATTLADRKPVVALHSAAAARHFAAEIGRTAIDRGSLFLLALAPRVAKAAGLGWAAVHLAEAPNDAALLAKAKALCQ